MQKIIDGVRLGYEVAGSGPALLLLHGFPFDRRLWEAPLVERLAARARVIRVDLRGSGESGRGEGPALMETLAGDLYGLLDALDVERVIVAGHSMGGYAGLAFFRMYAERVAGFALIASQVAPDTPARACEREAQAALVGERGMQAIADSVIAAAFTPHFAAADPAAVARVRAMVEGHDPAGAAAQIIGMKERVDSADLLADIDVPALLICGRNDRLIDVAAAQATAAAIAGCEFVALPGVAHMPMLEAPAETAAALERLVARCALSAAADSRSAPVNRV